MNITSGNISVDHNIAIVLGGITNHIILINKLKKRGYYTILVDYLDNPPAKKFADEHQRISIFDIEAIRSLALKRNVSLIVNACLEHVNPIAIKVSQELGLPVPYDYTASRKVSDKSLMKQAMLDSDVPTSKFICISDINDFDAETLVFPVFVKPADGSGSTAVNRAKSASDVPYLFEVAKTASRSGQVIIEEEMLGRECSVYTFINDGKARILNVAEKLIDSGDGDKITRCIATIAPAAISDKAAKNMDLVADKIAKGFELQNTPMFMQVKVNNDDVEVIEFGCRIAGGMSYRVIEERTGFDIFEGLIDSFLGIQPNLEIKDSDRVCAICSLLAKPGIFSRVEGETGLLEDGLASEVLVVRNKGTRVDGSKANGERVGFLLVSDENRCLVFSKIESCYARLKISDIDGNDIMRHDLYPTSHDLK